MTTFVYDLFKLCSPSAGLLQATYGYRVDSETLMSNVTWASPSTEFVITPAVERLAALLGFIEGLSYWKAFFASRFDIAVGMAPRLAKPWCEELLVNGMAECAYRNNLLCKLKETQVEFTSQESVGDVIASPPTRGCGQEKPSEDILLFSGGKDSLATHLRLTQLGQPLTFLRYEWKWSDKPFSPMVGNGVEKYRVTIQRELDAKLRGLNEAGAVNGHVPFSAYLGLAGVVSAEALGLSTVLAGNTRSDDEPNVWAGDWPINHQWSKSLEFEQSFRGLLEKLDIHAQYECPLRPFWEIQIVQYLLGRGIDLGALRTCNRVRAGWCGECAKCLWIFLATSALTDCHAGERILGFRPARTEHTLALLTAMAHLGEAERPFECTGTTVEVRAALGRVHDWLLPAGALRSAAAQWAKELPLDTLLLDKGPGAPKVKYAIELLDACGAPQLPVR